MPAIHQLLAGFANGDAISNEARTLSGIFARWGMPGHLFCEQKRILPQLRNESLDLSALSDYIKPSDIAVLHLSIGSPANRRFADLPCRKVILYHNITPSNYFEAVNPAMARQLALGRQQAADLAGVAECVLADSAFNARELESLGYRDVAILPLVLDFKNLQTAPDRATLRRFRDGRRNILFVGRMVPNKCIEDVITAYYYYTKTMDPDARLILVGSYAGTERYYHLLQTRIRDLALNRVHIAGSIPLSELTACYQVADAFLCMSEHEGFCIPLLESMFFKVPVLAYAAAAVPETLQHSGILVREKRFEWIAETLNALCRPGPLREAVINRQNERMTAYRERHVDVELRQHLSPLLS